MRIDKSCRKGIMNPKIYFPPMEGITGYVYRVQHSRFFPGIDKYFTPFVVSNYTRKFKTREKADIAPENNAGIPLVPQILSNKSDEFIWAASEMKARGYEEVNLNLGCPVPTITKKGKGSGFLDYPDELDRFLYEVCDGLANMNIRLSVKTRLGTEDFSEAAELIRIYNQYPLSELIIHARTQKDMYRNPPNLDVFAEVMKICRIPVCYNGNLFNMDKVRDFEDRFPSVTVLMPGRGIIADPSLVRQMKGGSALTKKELQEFMDSVYRHYFGTLSGERVIVNKMKEVWHYTGTLFADAGKYLKQIRKAQNAVQYEAAVRMLFGNCGLGGVYNGE